MEITSENMTSGHMTSGLAQVRLVTKPCALCGKMMEDVHPNRKYCPECAHQMILQKKHEAYEAKVAPHRKKYDVQCIKRPHEEPSVSKLDDHVSEATKLGLSYGKYMALMYEKKLKVEGKL